MKQYMHEYTIAITTFLHRIFDYATFKASFAAVLIVLSFLYDPLRADAMIALLVLIFIDFVTAILACMKTCETIRSSRIAYSAVKTAVYFLLIAAGYVAEQAIPLNVIDETIIAFLAATELVSVLENTSKAGYAVPQSLLNWLKDFSSKK